jgi:HEAT repeat protein
MTINGKPNPVTLRAQQNVTDIEVPQRENSTDFSAHTDPQSRPAPSLGKLNCSSAAECSLFSRRVLLAQRGDQNGGSSPVPSLRSRVAELIKKIGNPDENISGQAMSELEAMGAAAEDAIPVLERMINGRSIGSALAAISVLQHIGTERAAGVLLKVVEDKRLPNWGLSAAIFALERIGPKARMAVPAITQILLKSSDPETRRAAAYALGSLGSSMAQMALEIAQSDSDNRVRVVVKEALGDIRRTQKSQISKSERVNVLMGYLEDQDPNMKIRAIWLLGEMEEDAVRAVDSLSRILLDRGGRTPYPTYIIRRMAAKALGKINSGKAAPVLAKVVAEKRQDIGASAVREAAIIALGSLLRKGEIGAPVLMKVVEDKKEQEELRYAAIIALQAMEARQAVKVLTAALKDPELHIRAQAVAALAWMGALEAEQAVLALKGDPSELVRYQVQRAIRLFQMARKDDTHESMHLRENVTKAARLQGQSVAELLARLKGKTDAAQVQAIIDLGNMGSSVAESAAPALIKFLLSIRSCSADSLPSKARTKTVEALKKMASDRATVDALVKVLNETHSERCDVSESVLVAFEEFGPKAQRAVPVIIKRALHNDDNGIRIAAAQALGEIGSADAVDALAEAKNDANKEVSLAAAKALKKIGERIKKLGETGSEQPKPQRKPLIP